MAKEHKWEQDVDGAERCIRPRCTVRRYPKGGVWQRKKGSHWRSAQREPIPPCSSKEET